MKRLILLLIVLGLVSTAAFAGGQKEAAEKVTISFWSHFDNPEATIDPLVAKFESENPNIKVADEHVAWNSYHEKLLTAVAANAAPDVTHLKLWWQPQLVEMGALAELNDYIDKWEGRTDIYDRSWELTEYKGDYYMVPLQMVILYMYYRADWFNELGLAPATDREEFLTAAKKLTRDTTGDGKVDVWGFGIRGGRGGHDFWGTFVLSSGAQFFDAGGKTGLTSAKAIAANQWFIDLYRKHKVSPPTTPNDGFNEIVSNQKAGITAMTIHHIGSSQGMVEALGDKISAAPVPKGSEGAWTSYGDGNAGVSAQSKHKDEGFAFISFLATAENNAEWVKATGQVSINKSNGRDVGGNRFLQATVDSADFAGVMPAHPKTAEFVESLWPAEMQRALLGEISSEQMMETFAEHFTD